MLQKQCEKFQHSHLLSSSIGKESPKDSTMKLAYLAAFIVAECALNINRILKPFNPILGETFEYFDNNLKYRYISEQVSHHPPISAYICEHEDFVMFGDTRCKSKYKIFKGAMEINFLNHINIIFKASDQHYNFKLPTMYLKGLIFGTPHYDLDGVCEISSHNNKVRSKVTLEFYEEGRKGKPLGYVEGKITNETQGVSHFLKGQWNYGLYLIEANGKDINILKNIDIKNISQNQDFKVTELWRINEQENYLKKLDYNDYKLPKYSYNLNSLDDGLKKILPNCDSRFRPDQRYLEMQKMDLAEEVKVKVEENQRKRHKEFEANKIKYEPNYFSEVVDEQTKELIYIFNGKYWEDRLKKNFNKCYDIFNK